MKSYRRIDDLDKNSFYFVPHFETSSVITHCKSSQKGHHAEQFEGGGGGETYTPK